MMKLSTNRCYQQFHPQLQIFLFILILLSAVTDGCVTPAPAIEAPPTTHHGLSHGRTEIVYIIRLQDDHPSGFELFVPPSPFLEGLDMKKVSSIFFPGKFFEVFLRVCILRRRQAWDS